MMHQHDSTTATTARALLTEICLIANSGPVTSALICDGRPTVLQGLSDMLRPIPTLVDVACVPDGFALVDAYAAKPSDLVLIGVNGDNTDGHEAIGLLLGMNPEAVIIIVGSVVDLESLAAAYVRGARGLLLWEHDQASRPEAHPDGPLVW
jgi:DNA-binding NarL/FixJ family response regulator